MKKLGSQTVPTSSTFSLSKRDRIIDAGLYQSSYTAPFYDARSYGTLATAITQIGSTVGTLVISSPQVATADTTIPTTLYLNIIKGGYITISSGKVLTINGPLTAGLYQIFAGSGTVVFGDSSVSEVYPEWWGIDGAADNVEIQKALTSIESSSALETYPTTSDDYLYGGKRVILQDKTYVLTGGLEIASHCQLIGGGSKNTLISSSYDGQLIRSKYNALIYDNESIVLKGFKIKGDRTKTNQVGIDLLRCNSSILSDITVSYCGSHGIIARQCIVSSFRDVDTYKNIGDGIKIDAGVISWVNTTPNALPSNSNVFENIHSGWNDGAGLRINDSCGNLVLGGAYEYNYFSSGNNIGYNIVIEGVSRQNTIRTPWCEGAVETHVYYNLDSASSDTNTIDTLIHFGKGTSGDVNRAVICNCGNLILINPINHGTAYKTLNSSTAPFRLVKANVGKIFLTGGYSYNKTGGSTSPIEDENGNTANLANYMAYDYVNAGATRAIYGNVNHFGDAGETAADWYKTDGATTWDANPWLRLVGTDKSIRLGDGSIAPVQVVTTRKTGWTAASGTAARTTFATSTVTTEELAKRVKALLDDLISHGLIGA